MIQLTVDGKTIEAEEGSSLLQVCLDSGIYIPNLCFLKGMQNPPASCRLCFVEVGGHNKPVTSCKIKVEEGMVVMTDTPAVRRLQRSALRLLLSAHRVDCLRCPSNRHCDLQYMSKFLGVRLKLRRLEHLERELTVAPDHPMFEFDPHRCVLCGKCVYVCQKQNGHSLLTFAKRGLNTIITAFDDRDAVELPCGGCLACVEVCPVSAIFLKHSQTQKYQLPQDE